jgi:hypothetical protein
MLAPARLQVNRDKAHTRAPANHIGQGRPEELVPADEVQTFSHTSENS